MIPKDYITEWRRNAPWVSDAQVEQDLITSRTLVELYREEVLAKRLAFRGGTALYKLYVKPAARYSEDIDLVQIAAEPIGTTLHAIRNRLDAWLGEPRWKLKEGRVILVYRFPSEDLPPVRLRLKIEINSREHFTDLGLVRVPFRVENRWYSGGAEITTYRIDELFGTKLRALYQRKKGRDLFDLWLALDRQLLDPDAVVMSFRRYMDQAGAAMSRARFEANLVAKAEDPSFHDDVRPLLAPTMSYDPDAAVAVVMEQLVARLPGQPWKGAGEPGRG